MKVLPVEDVKIKQYTELYVETFSLAADYSVEIAREMAIRAVVGQVLADAQECILTHLQHQGAVVSLAATETPQPERKGER